MNMFNIKINVIGGYTVSNVADAVSVLNKVGLKGRVSGVILCH